MILENFYLNTIIVLLISYLIGSFPSAFIAGKIRGVNILRSGSGNVGGMNTISQVGKIAGVIVLIVDIGKGGLVAYLASKFSQQHYIPLLAVAAAVVGHNWMVYIGFRGGRGVATFLGGLLFLSPFSILFLYLIFIFTALVLTKDTYMSITLGFFFFSFFLWIRENSYWWAIFVLLITLAYIAKSYSLLKTYFTEGRRDIHPLVVKMFRPFFRGM